MTDAEFQRVMHLMWPNCSQSDYDHCYEIWRAARALLSKATSEREGWKWVPIEPTKQMIEDGAQRLVSWEDSCTWPDSWSSLQVAAARNEAERVWRSMWLAAATNEPTARTDPAAPAP